ncbi:MAG: YraN family protein [Candidatus Microgenomates bacterium]
MSLYKKNLGKIGEQTACNYLQNNGFKIIKRNFQTRFGEIDIIAEKNNTLYFIEVKTRSNLDKGAPYEAVNKYKIIHVKKAANYFNVLNYKYKNYKMKIGVFSIITNNNENIINFYDDLI